MIEEILRRNEFIEQPVVLVDIGASEGITRSWRKLAAHSICIAFEPDDRERGYIEKEQSKYKKLYIFNSVVSDKVEGKIDFHLTEFPFCSSILEPNLDSLQQWSFSDRFRVREKVQLNARTLPSILKELNITWIDWFKTDSQGIDLRLFESLGGSIINKVHVAEFEPGIIDAYIGEDKLAEVMNTMASHRFWVSDMRVEGLQRINKEIFKRSLNNLQRRFITRVLKTSPGWSEISFFNTFENLAIFSQRDLLLAWVFAIVKKQYGFALEIADRAVSKFNDPVFHRMRIYTEGRLQRALLNVPIAMTREFIEKVFKRIDDRTR